MAAGTVKYTKPEYGSLAGAMGEKIGSAISMAAGARKSQNEEIEKLQSIPREERTEEQEDRLEELLEQKRSQGKGFFFKKALGAEFGGDRIRRTVGFFQKDPKDFRDPALDKKKRFEALLAAQPAGVDRVNPAPIETASKGGGGSLGSVGTGIIEKISILGAKVDSLKSIIVGDKNPVIVERLSKNVREIGKFFAKNNSYDEQELKISQEQLETQIKAAEDAKEQRIENRGEKSKDNTDLASIDNERDGKKNKGIFGKVLDFITGDDFLDSRDRRPRRRKGGRFKGLRSRGRLARRKGNNILGLFRGGRRRKAGGVKSSSFSPRTQYTSEIGPLPRNSSESWAAKGPGDRGGIFGQEGFTPRLQSSPKKLASGGVLNPVPNKLASGGFLDNPTNVAGPAAAVPKNKLSTAVKQNPDNVKKATPFAKALQLPTMAAGSILFSTVANVLGGMGGVAKLFRPVIQRIFSPAAAVFGLPVNLISALFGGGPAAAATLDTSLFGGGKSKKDKKKKGGGGASPAAPITPGANLAGTSVAREVDLAGNTHAEVGFTSGFGLRGSPGGVGSTNHRGVDIGTSKQKGYYVAMRRSGTVVHNKSMDGAAGNWVGIKTDDGVEYRFMHLAQPSPLKVGETYTGQTIGEIGNTGNGTGEHLHFEKIVNGSHVDPKADAAALLDIGKTLNPMNATPTIAQPQSPGAPATPAPAGTPAALQQMMAPTTPIVIPGAPAPRALSSTGPLESPWPVTNPENPFAPTPF